MRFPIGASHLKQKNMEYLKIKEKCWYILGNKVVEDSVSGIYVAGENGEDVYYLFGRIFNPDHLGGFERIPLTKVFKTKEELLNSL